MGGAGKGRALRPLIDLDEAGNAAAVSAAAEVEAQDMRVPIVGSVAAGAPILAEQCVEDYLTADVAATRRAILPCVCGATPQRRTRVFCPRSGHCEAAAWRPTTERNWGGAHRREATGCTAATERSGCCRRIRIMRPSTAAKLQSCRVTAVVRQY